MPADGMLDNMGWFRKQALDIETLIPQAPKSKRARMLKAAVSFRLDGQTCARDAAPYYHPKLSAVQVGDKDGKPFVVKIIGDFGRV